MGRMFWMFAGAMVGAGSVYGAFNYHVLKTEKGIELVPKHTASLSDVYVDTTKFTAADWGTHAALAADVMASEKSQMIGDAGNTLQSGLQRVMTEIRQ